MADSIICYASRTTRGLYQNNREGDYLPTKLNQHIKLYKTKALAETYGRGDEVVKIKLEVIEDGR